MKNRVTPVIVISTEDVMSPFENDIVDEQELDKAHRGLKIAQNLTDSEWEYLVKYLNEWLYDGDQFYGAIRSAIENIAQGRNHD